MSSTHTCDLSSCEGVEKCMSAEIGGLHRTAPVWLVALYASFRAFRWCEIHAGLVVLVVMYFLSGPALHSFRSTGEGCLGALFVKVCRASNAVRARDGAPKHCVSNLTVESKIY